MISAEMSAGQSAGGTKGGAIRCSKRATQSKSSYLRSKETSTLLYTSAAAAATATTVLYSYYCYCYYANATATMLLLLLLCDAVSPHMPEEGAEALAPKAHCFARLQ